MPRRTYPYRPDYATPPGYVLAEYLEVNELTPAQFAQRHSLPTELVKGVLAGSSPIDADLAALLGSEFHLDESVWVRMEADYRRRLADLAAIRDAEEFAPWAKSFPVRELIKRGVIARPRSDGEAVVQLLDYFGVDSVATWQSQQRKATVAYRQSPTFASNEYNLAVWLRLGEVESEWQECAEYDDEAFRAALQEIRGLTRQPVMAALDRTFALCNQSGVALALVKPLPKVAVSGATRWLSSKAPLIQLSGRHKTSDHLWFTLFHEAAHVLLHSREEVFIDTLKDQIPGVDAEADRWASDFLVPPAAWTAFASSGHFSDWAVRRFAYDQGIAPAIVVGRLQHERLIPWSRLNHLKDKIQWQETDG